MFKRKYLGIKKHTLLGAIILSSEQSKKIPGRNEIKKNIISLVSTLRSYYNTVCSCTLYTVYSVPIIVCLS